MTDVGTSGFAHASVRAEYPAGSVAAARSAAASAGSQAEDPRLGLTVTHRRYVPYSHAHYGGNLVAAWRDAKVFTDAERAALELTEQGTRIADAAGGVTDEAWANAAKHYDDDQLGALVAVIALINAYNRMNVIIRQPAGDYQPGQFG